METTSFDAVRAWLDWALHDPVGRAAGAACLLFYVLVWWRILSRAGMPGALSTLMLVPPLAIGLWIWLAFAPWPIRRELTALRKVQRVVHQADRRRLAA